MKPFKSYDELMIFEMSREQYYRGYSEYNMFTRAFRAILDLLHPKYREIRKKYGEYSGGWWRDSRGHSFALNINHIDCSYLHEGDVCFEVNRTGYILHMYVYHDGKLWLVQVTHGNKTQEE